MTDLQRYVSDELTHFLGGGKAPREQYALLLHVLRTGLLAQPSYNAALSPTLTVNYAGSICNDDMFSPQIVCFCDIPVPDLSIHMRKYSRFGVSFPKSFLVSQGATPVFYIARNSTLPPEETRCAYFDKMLNEYEALLRIFELSIGMDHFELRRRLVDLRRFLEFGIFSYIKFFDDRRAEDDDENYYMEREWRLLGAVRFTVDDIARVIIPRDYARQFRSDVPAFFGQLTFVD